MEKITVERDRQEDTMIGSPLSDGKMVIKLKIPKLSAAIEGEKSSSEDAIRSLSTSSSKTAIEGETMNQGKRVCSECQKEFSSGKALGGHMRVHVQAANKRTFLKPSKTTKFKKSSDRDLNNGDENDMKKQQQQRKPYMNCVNEEGKPTCFLCGKIFPSMKSLFGHMRCHPDRVWRGILPPPPAAAAPIVGNKPNSPSLSETDDEEGSNIENNDGDPAVDLSKFIRGWSVTERRGRRALKAAEEDDLLMEAVEDLMCLANGVPSTAESDVTQRQLPLEVFEGCNSNSLTKIDENSPSIDLRLMDYEKSKEKSVMEVEIDRKPPPKMEFNDGGMFKNFSDNESESRNYKYIKSPNKIRKRKKMKLMMELEQVTVVAGGSTLPLPPFPPLASPPAPELVATESKFKCTTCYKCFTSHQALGGHRSSHNKIKITSTDHHHMEEDNYGSLLMNHSAEKAEKEIEFAGGFTVTPESVNSSVHQCKICDKVFPTGQALGGHKRCHWTGTTEAQAQAQAQAEAPSSQITSVGEEASQTQGGRKVLDFDLNEDPPVTMEDEPANGNGYASSSYNSNMW